MVLDLRGDLISVLRCTVAMDRSVATRKEKTIGWMVFRN